MGTLGRSKPEPLPWNGVQVPPRSVVLNKCPIWAGMTTAGSQLAVAGLAQFTAFESTELLDTNHVCLESLPPRLVGFCGMAMSLPLPIQIVPVPTPVTPAKWTLFGLTNVTGGGAGGGPWSTMMKEAMAVAPLMVTPP